jgi:hypothetical protein
MSLVRMSTAVLLTALEALQKSQQVVTLHLPKESEWISFDYGGARSLKGKVATVPEQLTFDPDQGETCYFILFAPYHNKLTNHLLDTNNQLTIRVEDIITIS